MIDGGLRSLFRERLPDLHWTSVETGGTGRGIPDSNYCAEGREGWIEYKQTAGFAVSLRPEQVAWLLRRSRAGGRTMVAVRRSCPPGPRRGDACDELWLLDGSAAVAIKEKGLGKLPQAYVLGYWTRGPAYWDWVRVRAVLLR